MTPNRRTVTVTSHQTAIHPAMATSHPTASGAQFLTQRDTELVYQGLLSHEPCTHPIRVNA